MRSIVTVTTPATDLNLTTLDNLKLELGIATTDEDDRLTQWIAQASAVAARYCNRTLALETITETFRLNGHHTHWRRHHWNRANAEGITLTRYPIVSVASVTVDDNLVDPTQYEFDISEIFRLTSSGYPEHWHFGKSVIVVYDAGYEVPIVPQYADLERAVIAMVRDFRAVTLRDDPTLKSRETVGVSRLEWWVPTAGTMMLPPEISGMLDPFVRKWGYMS